MKKVYQMFCRIEEIIANALLFGIMILVFVAAMCRTIGHPLNWAQDVALVAFAWMIFLGSDIAVRGPGLIGIDQTTAVYLSEPVADAIAVTFTAILFYFQFRRALRNI